MTSTSRLVHASPAQVWAVLADGWLYPVWVVGASRMREVDDEWPATGARLHHSLGAWPLLINDTTVVTDSKPGHLLVLRGRGWPVGEVDIAIRLRAAGADTEVVIDEDASAGPGLLVPQPLRGLALGWRNVETLRRLAYVAERRTTSEVDVDATR